MNDIFIETALTKYPKAKRVAVENFTSGTDEMDMATRMNLDADTRAYSWNTHTVNAILWVIGKKAMALAKAAVV
jgi:hypothetical protein